MKQPKNYEAWHQYESDCHGVPQAEYEDCVEQGCLTAANEAQHAELVRRVASEYQFTLSTWTPAIPVRS